MEQDELNGEEYAYLSDLVDKELSNLTVAVSRGTKTKECINDQKNFLRNLSRKLEAKHGILQTK